MHAKILFLCSILALATSLAARDKADVIVMRNGDRLTCEIKSLDADVLYISLDYVHLGQWWVLTCKNSLQRVERT